MSEINSECPCLCVCRWASHLSTVCVANCLRCQCYLDPSKVCVYMQYIVHTVSVFWEVPSYVKWSHYATLGLICIPSLCEKSPFCQVKRAAPAVAVFRGWTPRTSDNQQQSYKYLNVLGSVFCIASLCRYEHQPRVIWPKPTSVA